MTDSEMADLRARLEKATPGPWEAYSASCCPDMGGISSKAGINVCRDKLGRYGHPMTLEDAEFCAHAREDVPALLAEIVRLRAEVKAAYARGALAMREQAAKHAKRFFISDVMGAACSAKIRSLQPPEDV